MMLKCLCGNTVDMEQDGSVHENYSGTCLFCHRYWTAQSEVEEVENPYPEWELRRREET